MSICSYHPLSKYVKIFYLIIRDIAIVSELCMEFGKRTFILFFYFVCKFIYQATFFEIKTITLCDEPSFFFVNFFV